MLIPVNRVGEVGIVRDLAAHSLAPNVWSDGANVRFVDGAVEKILGHSPPLGTPLYPPYSLLPVTKPAAQYLIYGGLLKVGVVDSAGTHANITRQTSGVDVDYQANADNRWNGGVLGGVPVLTNGVDIPQMWNPVGLAQRMVGLGNWPATHRCKVIRPFKQYLVAANVTKSGTNFPYIVKWSHPADPGSIPVSWDENDSIRDAGEYDLSETGDEIVDAVPLGDVMFIYKEDTVWGMQLIGGIDIFRFYNVFRSFGALNHSHVVQLRKAEHLVFTGDDLIWHNGSQYKSVLQKRWRRWLRAHLDPTYFKRSFMVSNTSRNEVWLFLPTTSASTPDVVLIWNMIEDNVTMRAVPGFADACVEIGGGFPVKRMYMADPLTTKLFKADSTETFNGTPPTSWVERRALALPMQAGEPPDHFTEKHMGRLWPQFEGSGNINVYFAATRNLNDTPNYGSPKVYTIGSGVPIDMLVEGRLLNLKFEGLGSTTWRLHGYEVDVKPAGNAARA